jgi:hypothetical protein
MLMYTDNGGVDHLDSGVVGSGKRVYDAAPDASPPPADETVIAGRVRAKMIRQIAPRCPGSQDPEDAVEDTPVVYSRNATRLETMDVSAMSDATKTACADARIVPAFVNASGRRSLLSQR